MAKIISINTINKKLSPLTPLMINGLRQAMDRQIKNEILSQSNFKGSFVVLVKRGMIDCRQTILKGEKQVFWYVTNEGIRALNNADKLIKNAN